MIDGAGPGRRGARPPQYIAAAARAADFILDQVHGADGRLLHCWCRGQAKIAAFLDDYASLGNALVTLYETQFEPRWIEAAVALAEQMSAQFADTAQGGFFYAAADRQDLLVRKKDVLTARSRVQQASPTLLLVRLGKLCDRPDFIAAAEASLMAGRAWMEQAPTAAGQMLLALEMVLGPTPEIVILGSAEKGDCPLPLEQFGGFAYRGTVPFAMAEVCRFAWPLHTRTRSSLGVMGWPASGRPVWRPSFTEKKRPRPAQPCLFVAIASASRRSPAKTRPSLRGNRWKKIFMPELPEVETMRRGVAAAVGCTIAGVRQPPSRCQSITIRPRLARMRRKIVGRQIAGRRAGRQARGAAFRRRRCDCHRAADERPGLLADPPDAEHLRVVFELSGAVEQLLFWDQRGLGVVRLCSPAEFEAIYGPAVLGPDALTISAATLRSRLAKSRRAIKVALLDQHVVAGIGNLYASEILHRAAIHPALPCDRLKPRHWALLHAEIGNVLREAIQYQGSTLRDGTYRIARNDPGKFQFCHRVYQRDGKPCLGCGRAEIVRIVQAQRSTFFCPRCQKPSRASK